VTEPTRDASTASQAPAADHPTHPAATDAAAAAPVAATALGDSDDESPYLGTTLNSLAASASVNNITGEVSLTVAQVDRPTSQGLGPRLTINLVYNSSSATGSAVVSPYLGTFAQAGYELGGIENITRVPFAYDWDLDLPSIVQNGKSWSLRFQGQSWQANLNSDDDSPDKTAFYYAKALENSNKLKLSYVNGKDITGGATVTTPDGIQYAITYQGAHGWLLSSITSPNGKQLTFSYVLPEWTGAWYPQAFGTLSVEDQDGNLVYRLVAFNECEDTFTAATTVLYGSFTNPSQAGSGVYDTFATLDATGGVSQTGLGLYPNNPTNYQYATVNVGSVTLTKLSRITDPTYAYSQFNWLSGGFLVKYGVVHVVGGGGDNISHVFSYFFAPVDTQSLHDSAGNQVWSKQFYYSHDQRHGLTKNSDNGSATFQCPNMCEFDTNELAHGVAPANNWLDPLFNSSEHGGSSPYVPLPLVGENYLTGNVSCLIRVQTFNVYSFTCYPDGTQVEVEQVYDCLQRLSQVTSTTTSPLSNVATAATTSYTYPVAPSQLGVQSGDYTLPMYSSYKSLPANFDQPIEVLTTAPATFNGLAWSEGSSLTTTVLYTYDAYGNQTSGTAASGVSQTFAYAGGLPLPCNVNPYVSASTTTPSANTQVGALTLLPAQYLNPQGALEAVTGNTNSTVYTVADGCIRPSSMTTTASGNAGPLTRTYVYDASGRVSTVTESGAGFSSSQTSTYSTDANGNPIIATSTSYGDGANGLAANPGPALPTSQTIDPLGRTLSQTDAQGRVTEWQYDSLGRVTRQTELANLPQAQQLVTSYSYGLAVGGTSVTMTTPMGSKILYTFDSLGRQTSNQIQAVGDASPRTVRSFTYSNTSVDGGSAFGQLVSATTSIAPGAGTSITYYYNAVGDQVAAIPSVGLGQVSLPFNTGNYSYVLSFNCTWSESAGFALYGRASLVQNCAITGVTIASYAFDSSLVALPAGAGANGPLILPLGNQNIITSLINYADGSVNTADLTPANYAVTTSHSYDTLYRLVGDTLSGNGTSHSIGRVYDSNGRLAQMTDPTGSQYAMTYSPQGFATELRLTPAPSGPTYSLARTNCNAAGVATSYSNLACVGGAALPPVTTYSYDPQSGQIQSETDGMGNTVRYLWYPTGALAAIYSQTDTGWYLWSTQTYDNFGAVLTQQCGPIASEPSLSNLTPASPDARYSYVYDANGRMTSKTVQYAGQSPQTTTYSYDAYGNNTGFANPWGQTVSVTLDEYGRKSGLSAGPQTLTYAYDAEGNPHTVTRSYSDEGVTVSSTLTYTYDPLLRTTGLTESVQASQAGTTVTLDGALVTGFTQTLSYDFWDNIVGSTIGIRTAGGGSDSLAQTYAYDPWDRLVTYGVGAGSTLNPLGADGAAIASQAFQYDLLDNLTQTVETPRTGSAFTAEYDYSAASPFLLTSLTPRPGQTASETVYDALQRATTDSHGTRIAYDPLGRVASMTLAGGETIRYSYGPGGEAIAQSASDGSALYTYYEGDSPVARVDATGAVQARTLFGFASASTLPLTTHDLLGNPVLVRNLVITPGQAEPTVGLGLVANTVLAKNLFTATGVQTNLAANNPEAGYPQNLQPATGSLLSVAELADGGLGYNDAITDPWTGYQLLGGYRGYDPAVGRFHRPDSESPGAGLNPYAYTGNQFVGASDPTGHYTYTYKSYHKAVKSIEAAYARKNNGHSFWGQVASNFEHVVTNMVKHPGNVNTWVAVATTYANPMGPLFAAVSDQLRKAGPAGEVFSGVYDGIQSFAMSTASLGFASYNPQTGTGAFQSAGVGNMIGVISFGYANMAPNGKFEGHGNGNFGTHLERWGKGLGDLVENLVSGIAAVPIGLCYNMPVDFANGNYYMAGVALGANTAALVGMIAAPEDAGAAGEAEAAGESDVLGLGEPAEGEEAAAKPEAKAPQPGFFKSFRQGMKDGVKGTFKSGAKTMESVDRGLQGKFGSKAVREFRAKRFRSYCGEYLGKKIGGGLTNPKNYSNLNMTDPRSPWSTAAWQNMVYRQGPYKPKQK